MCSPAPSGDYVVCAGGCDLSAGSFTCFKVMMLGGVGCGVPASLFANAHLVLRPLWVVLIYIMRRTFVPRMYVWEWLPFLRRLLNSGRARIYAAGKFAPSRVDIVDRNSASLPIAFLVLAMCAAEHISWS